VQALAGEVKSLKGDVCGGGRKVTAPLKKAEDDLKAAAKDCVRGQDPQQQKAVTRAEAGLVKAEANVDALAQKGRITPACRRHYDEVIDKLIREGRAIDDTAPCPWASVRATFEIENPHCTHIVSDPLPENAFGQRETIDVQYGNTGQGNRLPFPGTVKLSASDPGATFSGDCKPDGTIALSDARRPTCTLSCECGIRSTPPPCVNPGERCAEGGAFCCPYRDLFGNLYADECVGGTCCSTSYCDLAEPCCPGFECDRSTNRCEVPSTTTTTVPCATIDEPCGASVTCCDPYECRLKVVSSVQSTLCHVNRHCPGFLQSDPFTITNPPHQRPDGSTGINSYEPHFLNFDLPVCTLSGKVFTYKAFDVATGAELASNPFPPQSQAIVRAGGSNLEFFVGEVLIENDTVGSQGGETKEIYVVVSWP
jgi:hypothetical protein